MNGRERNLGALLWSFETSFKVSQSRRPSSISGMRFYCLLIGVFGTQEIGMIEKVFVFYCRAILDRGSRAAKQRIWVLP